MSSATFAEKNSAESASKAKVAAKTAPSDLRIGPTNDSFEQEADRLADQVMSSESPAPDWSVTRMSVSAPLQRKCSCGGSGGASGECDECKKKEKEKQTVQRKASGSTGYTVAPPIVHEVLNSPGQPLDRATRDFFEPRFGHGFGKVRIHVGDKATESSRSVQARAFTVGSNIVFGGGQYRPQSHQGRSLIAHELAHTLQQRPTVARSILKDDSSKTSTSGTGGVSPLFNPFLGLPLAIPSLNSPPPTPAQLAAQLHKLIDGATWKEIRKRVYPKESAAGIQRAKQRKTGALPDLTGVGRIAGLEHFAGAVRNIQHHWGTSPDNRVKMLGAAANAELTAAEVPGFLALHKQAMEFKGFFRPSEWSFTISEALVTGASLSNDDAAGVANTTLHESRHAEQDFLAARFAAGVKKQDATQIAADQNIPKVIADKAVAKKFDANTSPAVAAMGDKMFTAGVTEHAKNQAISNDDGLSDLATKRGDAETAVKNLEASATPATIAEATAKRDALNAQITVVEQKYTAYRNIPYEADAHEVGDAAEQAFKGWP